MKAIVAVDINWGIGCGGNLLQMIPEDMKFFKQMTLGKVVIMGRQTFESLPGKAPLKNRINIVLSKSMVSSDSGIIICRSLKKLFHQIEKYNTEDVFIIGGESIYTQFLPYCEEAYVTSIQNAYSADKHFINLDKEKAWERVSVSDSKEYNDIQYNFVKYVNNQVICFEV